MCSRMRNRKEVEEVFNEKLFRIKVNESGYKMTFIAEQCGITYQGFLKKLKGESEFKVSETMILKELLHLTDEEWKEIFFTDKVD